MPISPRGVRSAAGVHVVESGAGVSGAPAQQWHTTHTSRGTGPIAAVVEGAAGDAMACEAREFRPLRQLVRATHFEKPWGWEHASRRGVVEKGALAANAHYSKCRPPTANATESAQSVRPVSFPGQSPITLSEGAVSARSQRPEGEQKGRGTPRIALLG
jgi:hypothetical protein